MKVLALIVLTVAVFCVTCTESVLPGFKLRLSKKGLDYANGLAQTAMATELKTLKIPNQSGDDHHLKWSLTNIQNRGVAVPTSAMTFSPGKNGLTWAINGLGIDLHADWRVKYKKGWIHVSTSGSVDLKVKQVSLQATIQLGQAAGRPSVSLAACSASVGGVDVHFHGGTAFILNLFKGVIGKKIRDMMKDQICKVAQKEINVDANKKLSQLKVNTEIDHRFLLDYSLVSSPLVHATDLETQHKGETFWKGDVKEAPFSPKPIPALADESRMMYLWVTDYVWQSLAYVAQNHSFLQYNVTGKDLPAKDSQFLNTTCKGVCIGNILPQIGKKFPNATVEARVASLSAPTLTAGNGSVTVNVTAYVSFFAHSPDHSVNFLFTLSVNLAMSVKASVVSEKLTGEVSAHSFTLKLVKSAVGGDLQAKALNLIISKGLDWLVIPGFNVYLKKGVDLPVTGSVAFQNTALTLNNGVILIATDLKAKIPPSSDLRFISERGI